MRLTFRLFCGVLFAWSAVAVLPPQLLSQQMDATALTGAVNLPDAPPAQLTASEGGAGQQAPPAPTTPAPTTPSQTAPSQTAPSGAPAGRDSSSAPAPASQTDAQKSQREQAQEQLKAEEHQRVMGVMATFNTTTNRDALPLSPGQKFQLFFKGETDPWPFGLALVVAGINQAENTYPEWGQGVQGYAKRFGGAYTDAFIGNFFGNAVLTSILHEDPRYFQKGTGGFTKRLLWAAASTIWCRRDNGTWGPNYANVGGNLIGSAISRVYYPASQRTVGDTIEDGFTVSAEGIVGSEVIEFWPDIVRHYKRKREEKAARQQAPTAPPAGGQK
jgi:hypothetical protein